MGSAVDLGQFLREKGSPWADQVPAIMRAANRNRVDPRLLVAIAGAESAYGKVVPSGSFNPFGIGPGRRYSSWEEGFNAAATLLRKHYIGEGRKGLAEIGKKWAPVGAANDPTGLNSNWYRNTSTIYTSLGGDPKDVTRGWRNMASPAAVESLPSQTLPDPAPGLPAVANMGDAAFQSLGRVARGEAPTRTLRDLVQQVMTQQTTSAAAATTVRDQEEKPKVVAADVPKPGGGWGGSFAVAKGYAEMAAAHGLTSTSEKRDRQRTASGNVSDHWTGSTNAYAVDLSGTVEQMDAAAARIAASLGVRWDGRSPLEIRKVVNGYRIQVLYRTQTGGNHDDHIHVGVRKYA